jgi:hypothetical protein
MTTKVPRDKIYVIHSNSKIESLYTLFPLLISQHSRLIKFIHVASVEAKKATGECVILVRVFKGNKSFAEDEEKKRAYIKDFKKRFNRVIMLDDGAGSDSLHFEYMDLVDLYYKGKLLKDRQNYLKPMYGRQIFTNYYNQQYGVTDDKFKLREVPADPSLLKKLRVSWNLGYGLYPIPSENAIRLAKGFTNLSFSKALTPWLAFSYQKMLQQLSQPVDSSDKLKKVQARFGSKSLPNTIGYQRRIFIEKCHENKNIITGNIKPKEYNKEIKKVAAVLSPFGWGEICFRDFEAIINGCLLLKPNMDHIETWPDVYKSNQTYLPVDWDGKNLVETINNAAENCSTYSNVIEAAKEEYKKSLLAVDHKVFSFLEEATGRKLN